MTFVEEATTVKHLEKLAKEAGLTVSDLLRQATWEYVKSRASGEKPVITRDRK